jgi:hypothetical protein
MSAVPPTETVPNRDLAAPKARFANAGRIYADDQNVKQDGEISTLQSRAGVIESNLANEISLARSTEAQALADAKTYTDNQLTALLGANVSGALSQLQNFAYEVSQTPTGNLLNELSDINSGISTEKALRIAGDLSLETALSAEVVRAVSVETWLGDGLNQENIRAVSAESSLTSRLSIEGSMSRSAEVSLETRLSVEERNRSIAVSTEISRATTAENSLASALSVSISTEFTRATSAELSLQSRLVDADSAINARITGVESTTASSLSSAISTERLDRSTAIQGAINTEVTARTNAINAESSILKTYTDSAVASEVTNRTNAITTLSTQLNTSLSTEIARAISSETSLQGRLVVEISTEFTRATSAEASLAASISTELSRALSAEASLQATISTGNGDLDTFKASTSTNFAAVTQAFNVIFGAIDIEKYVGSAPDYFAYSAGTVQTLSAPAPAPAPADYSTGTWGGGFTYKRLQTVDPVTTQTITGSLTGTGSTPSPMTISPASYIGEAVTFTPSFTLSGRTFTYTLAVGTVVTGLSSLREESSSVTFTPSSAGSLVYTLRAYESGVLASTLAFNLNATGGLS